MLPTRSVGTAVVGPSGVGWSVGTAGVLLPTRSVGTAVVGPSGLGSGAHCCVVQSSRRCACPPSAPTELVLHDQRELRSRPRVRDLDRLHATPLHSRPRSYQGWSSPHTSPWHIAADCPLPPVVAFPTCWCDDLLLEHSVIVNRDPAVEEPTSAGRRAPGRVPRRAGAPLGRSARRIAHSQGRRSVSSWPATAHSQSHEPTRGRPP